MAGELAKAGCGTTLEQCDAKSGVDARGRRSVPWPGALCAADAGAEMPQDITTGDRLPRKAQPGLCG